MIDLKIGDDIRLSSLRESFAAPFADLVSNNRPSDSSLDWPYSLNTKEEFSSYIAKCQQQEVTGTRLSFAVFLTNKIVGKIEYRNIDETLKSAEIAGWIIDNPELDGVMTKCCIKLTEYAFNTLNLDSVDVAVAKDDQHCRNICESFKMKLNGIRINANSDRGNKIDLVVYSAQANP